MVAGITADVILKEEMAELAEKSKSDYSKFPLIAWCQQLYDTTRIVSVWLDSQLRVYGLSLIAYSLAIQKLFNYSDDSNK